MIKNNNNKTVEHNSFQQFYPLKEVTNKADSLHIEQSIS